MASSNSIFIPGLRIFVSQFNVNIHETLLDATYWLTKMKLHLFLKYFFEEFLPLLMWKDWVGPTEWKKPLALSVWFPCQKMARQGAQGGLFSCITFKASAKLCVSRIHMKTPLVVLTMAMHGLIWLSKGDARDLKSLLLGCKTLRWPPGGMHVKSLDWFTPLRGFESVPGESCVRGWGVSHLWYQGS